MARHWGSLSEGPHNLVKQNKNLDCIDPSSAFIGAEVPPFLPHLRVDTVSINGREQKDRDQRDAEDAGEEHSGTRKPETETEA